MDVKSIDLSRSLLQLLRDLPEDQVEGFVDALRFEVSETGDSNAAAFAANEGVVGMVVLNGEDGSTTLLTLKLDSG